jgi:hypothetical protein
MQVSERHVGVLVDEIVASLKREAILQEQAERLGAHH